MLERCKNCGAELFAGQQFCRLCGTPTGLLLVGENVPTQILPPNQPAPDTGQVEQNATVRLSTADTGASFPSQSTSFYAPASGPHAAPTNSLQSPGRRRSRRGWIFAFIMIGLVGVVTLVGMLFAISSRMRTVRIKTEKARRASPAAPLAPPAPGPEFGASAGVLDEDQADVSDDQTVLKKTFNLAGHGAASVSLKNMSGKISIEGWDQPTAAVKITKRGGSEEERRAVRIASTHEQKQLTLHTAAAFSQAVKVEYEIKVPRTLRQLEIASMNSDVELSNLRTDVILDLQRGRVVLADVDGEINAKITQGNTTAVLDGMEKNNREPYHFSTIHGDVELRLDADTNADVKAEVIDGQIEVDDDFGLEVEKRFAGAHLVGRIGAGGRPILIKVVKGNIKLRQ